MTATPYTLEKGEGVADESYQAVFDLVDPISPTQVAAILVDAENDILLDTITEGAVIDLALMDKSFLSIMAINQNSPYNHFKMVLEGPLNHLQMESIEPYTLFGDNQGDFHGRSFPVGDYTLIIQSISENGSQSLGAAPVVIHFEVIDNRPAFIQSITLVKALRGGDIQTIKEGDAIILDPIDLPVNIRANVSGVTSKVQFNLSGSQGFIKNAFERVRPFMLFGDKHGWVFNPGNIPVDDYHIRVYLF